MSKKRTESVCSATDGNVPCENPVHCRSLCGKHYQRLRTNGSITLRIPAPIRNYHGYRMVKRPDHPLANKQGYVLEHRLVAWEHYGPFDPRDDVHHVNGVKTDNRPENLEVLTPEAHGREHHVIDRDRAVEMYRSGMTTIEVAKALGTFPGNVSRMLRSKGGGR